jgi:signal transduction histidine kinase
VFTKSTPEGIVIEIADNGVGMESETVAKAFIPFFTTRSKGTGVGLVSAEKIVTEHGGTIALESEFQRGTMVTVSIPAGPG